MHEPLSIIKSNEPLEPIVSQLLSKPKIFSPSNEAAKCINVHPLDACPLPLPRDDLSPSQLPRGIMSLSLGAPSKTNTIQEKIEACAAQGFKGIEIHVEDVKAVARSAVVGSKGARENAEASSSSSSASAYFDGLPASRMISAAKIIGKKCKQAGLQVICLEPLLHYPGLLPLSRRDDRLRYELPVWFAMSDALGTDLIQVASAMFKRYPAPSSGSAHTATEATVTGDDQRVIEDLRLLAHAGQAWPSRTKYFAYEAMCFGAYVTSWQDAWRQVCAVNEDNFGMVFDTFQILAGSKRVLGGNLFSEKGFLASGWEEGLEEELQELHAVFGGESTEAQVNRRKVFFAQLGDAKSATDTTLERLFDPAVHANPMMAWARSYRAFAGEGRLPVQALTQFLLKSTQEGGMGYRGWLSAEVFARELSAPPETLRDTLSQHAAQRCEEGFQRVLSSL